MPRSGHLGSTMRGTVSLPELPVASSSSPARRAAEPRSRDRELPSIFGSAVPGYEGRMPTHAAEQTNLGLRFAAAAKAADRQLTNGRITVEPGVSSPHSRFENHGIWPPLDPENLAPHVGMCRTLLSEATMRAQGRGSSKTSRSPHRRKLAAVDQLPVVQPGTLRSQSLSPTRRPDMRATHAAGLGSFSQRYDEPRWAGLFGNHRPVMYC
mmetsp:Transcript_32717/g.84836  ORF Transcript_32717/g.84836 Transcript_32717/m.84836 type:complete len:210 (-) Transcript_32717:60-689(-)